MLNNYQLRTTSYLPAPKGCPRYETTNSFMQNKPNFQNDKMNITPALTKDYENISPTKKCENKPNQTQFQYQICKTNPIEPNFYTNYAKTNPIKPNFIRHSLGEGGFKRDLAKMGNHETAKGVDTVMEFTLNLIKNSEAKE